MTTLQNKVVAITGAGSGIGRALALGAAGKGALLALSDRDAAGLAETADLVRAARPKVRLRTDEVDVSNESLVRDWASAVAEDFGRVNVIINNAGVAFSGDVAESTLKDLEWVMGVNFFGVVHGTTAFLPHLVASGEGHVVNISSLFGLLATPSQSQYTAAKFAVRGWTETFREEMLISGSPVKVTCVHPGGIKTGIARNGRAAEGLDPVQIAAFFDKKLAKMEPEQAAAIIIRGIEKNKPRVLVGADAYALDLMQKVLGARYQRLVALTVKRMRPYSSARVS
ncbi:SDR family NAD(P)-dependent oxidoreductase [Jatrophihabitans sp. YIM 134969]